MLLLPRLLLGRLRCISIFLHILISKSKGSTLMLDDIRVKILSVPTLLR